MVFRSSWPLNGLFNRLQYKSNRLHNDKATEQFFCDLPYLIEYQGNNLRSRNFFYAGMSSPYIFNHHARQKHQ